MSLPPLLPIPDIQIRLQAIFPPGLAMRGALVREMAAKTVWVLLYGGMVDGARNLLRPSHIYFYTEDQAALTTDDDRTTWLANSMKQGFRPPGVRWYADTTREPIRDETLRLGLVDIGAVGKIDGVATTSSKPIYFLKSDFAALFDPALTGAELDAAIEVWQERHLSSAARARMAMLSSGKVKRSDDIKVACPDGTVVKLAPGPSSLITKGVVEDFADKFLPAPALLWMSESGNKVRYHDDETARKLGLIIDPARVLPDVILMSVGETGDDTHIIFIEVVNSDGAMTQQRKDAFIEMARRANFPQEQCHFGTAFEDRVHGGFTKTWPQLAWGTFVWFRSEPEHLLWMREKPFDITK
ncbi:BsuBI/PstI family type II restriction endonuclease [Janthinobacterium sp. CAN_S7]|uniref:BsuBI/PstI family type II restriction endonuclease n=1 Tax=Janthinobacterium sp. CAN_S7 TaxID=3071704 RepID=UPI00319E5ECC